MKQTDSATAPDGAGTSAVAAGGGEVNGAAKQAETANGSAAVAQEGCRVDTREDQGAIEVRNQNESGGLTALPGKALSWTFNKCLQLFSRPVSQCTYVDRDENVTLYDVICRSVIERSLMTPYKFQFQHPSKMITGIACVPRDTKTPSPEVKVVSGGVGFKEVEILLTPLQKGEWCCIIQINGIKQNPVEQDTVPNALTM